MLDKVRHEGVKVVSCAIIVSFTQCDVSNETQSATKHVGQWSVKADLNMTTDNFSRQISDPALEVN